MKAPDPSMDSSSRRAALEKRLLAVARMRPIDERVPPGFARRVQAKIAAGHNADVLGIWLRGFWQALIPALGCLAVVIGLQQQHTSRLTNEIDMDTDAAEISLWDAFDATTSEAEL